MNTKKIGLAMTGLVLSGGLAAGATSAYAAAAAPDVIQPSSSGSPTTDSHERERAPGDQGPHTHRHERSQLSEVTGAEKNKVVAAIKAKDASVTVTDVRKTPDGTYLARATKSGDRIMVKVSKDLKSVAIRDGGPRLQRGGGCGAGGEGKKGEQSLSQAS
jgi:hypothetical protein